jgi:ketosteroid isomerase-like protein
MTNQDPKTAEVKKTIDDLIQTATNYDIDALDRIYHKDLEVTMVSADFDVNIANKDDFKAIFSAKLKAGEPPMNTWAKYHRVSVEGKTARVLLSRKNNLNGQDMELFLTIDLLHEDGYWQVHREVIFLRPEPRL